MGVARHGLVLCSACHRFFGTEDRGCILAEVGSGQGTKSSTPQFAGGPSALVTLDVLDAIRHIHPEKQWLESLPEPRRHTKLPGTVHLPRGVHVYI